MRKMLRGTALLFFFLSGSLLAQSEFWAASFISKYTEGGNKISLDDTYKTIAAAIEDYRKPDKLNAEYIDDKNQILVGKIKEKIAEYLKNFIELDSSKALPSISAADFSGLSANISSSKGFSLANLADGMAKFLVERTKEEMNAAFFKRFQDVITGDKYQFMRDLFPETYSLLLSISDRVYYFRNYLQSLRGAFLNDLDSMSFKIIPFLLNDQHFEIDKNIGPGLKQLLILANDTVKRILLDSNHPGIIIEDIALDKIPDDRLSTLRQFLFALKVISKSLRNKDAQNNDPKTYWVGKDELFNFFWKDQNDFNNLKIYLGLIQLRIAVIKCGYGSLIDRDSLIGALKNIDNEEVIKVAISIKNICLKTIALDEAILDINKKFEWERSFNDYYKMYGAVLDIFDGIWELHKVLKAKKGEEGLDLKRFVVSARALGRIALAIKQKEYCSIVNQIVLILDEVFRLPAEEKILVEAKTNSNDAIKKNGKLILIAKDSAGYRTVTKIRNIISGYGSFICAVANAENSTQIKEAIESIVLPAGSSNIKKTTPFGLAVNAYVGGSLGVERNAGQKGDTFAGGLYGPIGLAFSFSNAKTRDSLSIFVPVVDLGALISYRFTNQENEGLPQFILKNIISPGVYVVAGFPGIPLSFGLGFHHGPELVEITDQAATLKTRFWRFGFFLAVDIPLINFWTDLPR